MARIFLLFSFFLIACQATNVSDIQVVSGTLERLNDIKSSYISSRPVDVWLPDGYSSSKKYNVLYMHDGQMLFDSTKTWNKQEWGIDETMGHLLREKRIEETIIVGIWNVSEQRHADYFPQKPFESLAKNLQDSLLNRAKRYGDQALFTQPVSSDNYLRFIVEELKPLIDTRYSTKSSKGHTFIAGSSMGGLISLYALCEYPQIFGGAACLSTHWIGTFTQENNPIPGVFIDYLSQSLPLANTCSLYFDYGTETLDSLYSISQQEVDSLMRSRGYDARHWTTKKYEGHDHSENAWRERMHIPLQFLLQKR